MINDAYMILLKKKEQPVEIKDYLPISLIHSFGKLITKCLARRLGAVLDSLVRPNQTAFIRGRCIHDNFHAVQLACKAIHAKRVPCVLLKIDIAKAFDSVAWNFLLEVLVHMGFGQRWRDWISCILSTASTKILLNGRPGRRICHARGVRQGDPLLLMLFVLVMEVLNHLFGWLDGQGFLTPLGITALPSRVRLYADDVVMFVVPKIEDLLTVKCTVQMFGEASGLFSNLDKSVATPIGCSDLDIDLVQETLSCKIEAFPCRYLGIPLSIYKLKKMDEQILIDSVAARIPQWKGKLLNVAGRMALAKATLSAIPVHMPIALCLSPWALEQIDKRRRAFIWCGELTVSGRGGLARWPGRLFVGRKTWEAWVLSTCAVRVLRSGCDGNGSSELPPIWAAPPCIIPLRRWCPRSSVLLLFRTLARGSPRSFGLIIGLKVTASRLWHQHFSGL